MEHLVSSGSRRKSTPSRSVSSSATTQSSRLPSLNHKGQHLSQPAPKDTGSAPPMPMSDIDVAIVSEN